MPKPKPTQSWVKGEPIPDFPGDALEKAEDATMALTCCNPSILSSTGNIFGSLIHVALWACSFIIQIAVAERTHSGAIVVSEMTLRANDVALVFSILTTLLAAFLGTFTKNLQRKPVTSSILLGCAQTTLAALIILCVRVSASTEDWEMFPMVTFANVCVTAFATSALSANLIGLAA